MLAQRQPAATARLRTLRLLKSSTTPYLVSLSLTVIVAGYANYVKDRLDPAGFAVFGQSPGIYLPFLLFPVTFALWIVCKEHGVRNVWLGLFLGGLTISWIIHFYLIQLHNDPYVYNIFLFLPIVGMLCWKPPTWNSAFNVLRIIAGAAVVIMVLTFVFENLDLLPQFLSETSTAPDFERANYWLPLMDIMQLDGRWHGPFGYSSKTAFMSAFVLLVGLADKGWIRWVLVAAGSIALLSTGSRGAYLALAVGLAVVFLFARNGPMARINIWLRMVSGALGFAIVSIGLYSQGALGLTGREPLWSGYLDLWRDSVWVGVGQRGIANSPPIVEWMGPAWMDAHSIYVQELTQGGVIGFTAVFLVIAVGTLIALVAAIRGLSLPLAIITVYLVAGITDLLHNGWESVGAFSMIIILSVLGATSFIREGVKFRTVTHLQEPAQDELSSI